MGKNIKTIKFENPFKNEKLPGGNRLDFVSCEILFPGLENSLEKLTCFCDKIVNIGPTLKYLDRSVSIVLNPMGGIELMNPFSYNDDVHIKKFKTIIINTISEYIPMNFMEKVCGERLDNNLVDHISIEIKAFEEYLIRKGYFTFKDALRFRLGILYA